jgi:hypothetical protein
MLDMIPTETENRSSAALTYTDTDPTQKAFRARLVGLSDADLMEIERDLEYLAISGVVPVRIEALLFGDAAATPLARVA